MLILKERRRQKRYLISLPVTYLFSDKHKVDSNDGTAFDFSDSGMSFYTDTPLFKGHNLQVHTQIWKSSQKSIVKWCSKKYLNIYKVGVSFS